jgi:hypothetical protein
VPERGEQLDRPVADPAQPLADDRDVLRRRVLWPVGLPGGGQGPQPAADEDVQRAAVQVLQEQVEPLENLNVLLPSRRRPPPRPCGVIIRGTATGATTAYVA